MSSVVNLNEREVSLSSPSSALFSVDVQRELRVLSESLDSVPSHLRIEGSPFQPENNTRAVAHFTTYVLDRDVVSTRKQNSINISVPKKNRDLGQNTRKNGFSVGSNVDAVDERILREHCGHQDLGL